MLANLEPMERVELGHAGTGAACFVAPSKKA